MKDTAQELTCSICSNKYAQNRPKVRLCSNFHYICFPCLQNIAKINPMNPKCPSCKAQLDIKQIEREQKVYKSICPLPHYSQKLKYEQSICSQCEREGLITMLCETCHFRVCSDCHFKFHMKSCKETEREYFANLQFAGKCGKCGKKEKNRGSRCSMCKVIFCLQCMTQQKVHRVVLVSKAKEK